MALHGLAERVRGLVAASPAAAPPSSAAAPPRPPTHPPTRALPAAWLEHLRGYPRLATAAVARNSMSASLALLTTVLMVDALMTEPVRRRRAASSNEPQLQQQQQQQQQPQPQHAAAEPTTPTA